MPACFRDGGRHPDMQSLSRDVTRLNLDDVLRLLDARIGSYTEVRPARPGLLRVCAHLRQETGEPDFTGLRVLLVADLLARAAELRGLQVLTAVVFPGQPPAQPGFPERAAAALGIHPPAARASSAEAEASLGGPVDVHVASAGIDGLGALVAVVGAARVRGVGDCGELAGGAMLADQDALAVRLALMSFPHHRAVDFAESAMARDRQTIGDWRQRVAEWAESPSKPMPKRISQAIQAAFGDLDMVLVLALLRGLALDAGVPAGAKFETFAFADRILGLELAREIGRSRH